MILYQYASIKIYYKLQQQIIQFKNIFIPNTCIHSSYQKQLSIRQLVQYLGNKYQKHTPADKCIIKMGKNDNKQKRLHKQSNILNNDLFAILLQCYNSDKVYQIMKQINMKRQQYANEIRKEKRYQIRNEIRKKIIYSQVANISQKQIIQMIKSCEQDRMSQLKIKQLLSMMNKCNLRVIATEHNLQFVLKILKFIDKNQYKSQFIHQVIINVQQLLQKIITQDGCMVQQGQNIINNCFITVYSILQYKSNEFFRIWNKISVIKEEVITKLGAFIFIRVIQKMNQLNDGLLSIVLKVFDNYAQYDQENNIFGFSWGITITLKIGIILDNYQLSDQDLFITANTIRLIIGKKPQQKVQAIINSSEVLNKIFEYLQPNKVKFISQKTTIMIVRLLAKVFSTNQKISMQIYQKVPNIIPSIRNLLPIENMIGIQKNKQPKIIRNLNLELIRQCAFALSNIVASSFQLVQLFLQTDLYDCLRYLYIMTNPSIKEQISFVYINLVLLSVSNDFLKMIDNGIIQMIETMVKQDNSKVKQNGIRMLGIIAQRIKSFNFKYNLIAYRVKLQQIGIFKFVEPLAQSQNQQIAKYAHQFLNHFD